MDVRPRAAIWRGNFSPKTYKNDISLKNKYIKGSQIIEHYSSALIVSGVPFRLPSTHVRELISFLELSFSELYLRYSLVQSSREDREKEESLYNPTRLSSSSSSSSFFFSYFKLFSISLPSSLVLPFLPIFLSFSTPAVLSKQSR